MGGSTIRGSSTRGGAKAMRDMMSSAGRTHVGVTPDGPRGPRRVMQPGAIYLASATGLQVVPVGISAREHRDTFSKVRFFNWREWTLIALVGTGPAEEHDGAAVFEFGGRFDGTEGELGPSMSAISR